MAAVDLEQVCKTYANGVQALRALSLHVEAGELFVLLGPSGCGKTTTLRLIAGLETPTSGAIRLGGRDMVHVPPHERDVAMLFQSAALYPHLSVDDNLAFGFRLRYNTLSLWSRRGNARELEHRVSEAVELLGLEGLLDRTPAELSGGERQRVALGRALVRRSAVFLFDEPLAHVDTPLRVRMRQDLRDLQRRLRVTTIYVTHDHVEALALGDRIGVMKEGTLQQVGSREAIYEQPANRFVAGFVGSPPMNLLSGRLMNRDDGLCFQTEQFTLCLPSEKQAPWSVLAGRGLVLGIRPEDIALGSGSDKALHLQVALLECMGSETWVTLPAGTSRLIARLQGGRQLKVGEDVTVSMNWDRVHLFDEATGARLHGSAGRG